MIKILVIGNTNGGKTQLINRFVSSRFDNAPGRTTIGPEFSIQILKIDGHDFRLQIWDLAGDERVASGVNRLFCKGASGALIVADITDPVSIENTVTWKRKIN
jgi:small GTP-binding protein